MPKLKCKILSGSLRGRNYFLPNISTDLRPTTQKNRLAIFNILGRDIIDASFLDLYCGSAAMTLEAYSRGAKYVLGIDSSRALITNAIQIAENFKIPKEQINFICQKANKKIELNNKFDIIFVDPPYADTTYPSVDIYSNLLEEKTLLIMEHRKSYNLKYNNEILKMIDTRSYGDTSFSIFKKVTES